MKHRLIQLNIAIKTKHDKSDKSEIDEKVLNEKRKRNAISNKQKCQQGEWVEIFSMERMGLTSIKWFSIKLTSSISFGHQLSSVVSLCLQAYINSQCCTILKFVNTN